MPYHQEAEVLWKKIIKFIGDENSSNKQLKVGLVSIVVTLIEIMWSLRGNKKQSFELNISLSTEVTPRHRLVVAKVLQKYDVRDVTFFLEGIKSFFKQVSPINS
jgi:hypothetical protein